VEQPQDTETGHTEGIGLLSYFARHWRGAFSLGISFWLTSLITVGLIRAAGLEIVAPALKGNLNPTFGLLLASAYVLLTIVATLWHATGTWRSARRHRVRRHRRLWPNLAIMTVLVLVAVSAKWVANEGPYLVETAKIVAGAHKYSKHEVTLVNGTDLHLSGYLGFKLLQKAEGLLEANPRIHTVHLNLIGVWVNPARRLRDLIQARKLDTVAGPVCAYGCTLVFMAGERRIASVGATLGFVSYDDHKKVDGRTRDNRLKDIEYFRKKGVTESFVTRAFEAPRSKIWNPTLHQLMTANIVTHVKLGKDIVAIAAFCDREECRVKSTAPRWLQDLSAQVNRIFPAKVDELTRVERTVAGPGKQLTYHMTLIKDIRLSPKILSSTLLDSACTKGKLDKFFTRGIVVGYVIRDKDGRLLHEARVTPSICDSQETLAFYPQQRG
jgi:hypothetical protein